MESQSLAVIASDLRKQWNIANEKATALRTELGAIEEEATRIDAALAALSGSTLKAAGNGSKGKESKRATQTPSAKKADVIAAMRCVLEKATVMEATALKEQVEAVLTADGFNRFGFAMRWKEATQDPQFIDTPQGLTLRDKTETASNETHRLHARPACSSRSEAEIPSTPFKP